MKPAYRLSILLIMGLSINSVLGCTALSPLPTPIATLTDTTSQLAYSLPSLQDQWGLLEEKAHEWQSDAFLMTARIDINKHATYQIMAIYYSPSVRNSLSIAIENSGEITVMSMDTSMTSLRPIRRESWTIDSQEALLAFSEDQIINSCLQSTSDPSDQPIDMTLFFQHTNLVVWRLDIWNCPKSENFELKSYYLDAQTGEMVNPLEN